MSLVINPVCGHTCDIFEPLWYIVPYYQQIRDYVSRRRTVHYLEGKDANREKVWRVNAERHPTYIIATGHGDASVYTAYKLERVYWVDMSEAGFSYEWLRGCVMLMLSCVTAKNLGPFLVSKGVWSYLGWDHLYGFIINVGVRKGASWELSPDRLFFNPIEYSFSRCATREFRPRRVYDYIYDKYSALLVSDEIPDRWKVIIKHDRDHMRLIGMGGHPGEHIDVRALAAIGGGAVVGVVGGLIARREKERRVRVL